MVFSMEVLEKNNFTTVTRPQNLSTQIEEQLLDAIKKGVFSVGSYLPSENKLVEIFGVSRGVIRESLLMLSARGIVDIQKGKGALMLKPSINSILDPFSSLVNYRCGNEGLRYTQEIRIMLEPHVASLTALKRTNEDLEKMEKSIDYMLKYQNNKELMSYYDVEFHQNISHSCGNPMFSIILEPIYHFLHTYHEETFEDIESNKLSLEFHYKILDAIEKKDSKTAFDVMEKHLSAAKSDIEKLYTQK